MVAFRVIGSRLLLSFVASPSLVRSHELGTNYFLVSTRVLAYFFDLLFVFLEGMLGQTDFSGRLIERKQPLLINFYESWHAKTNQKHDMARKWTRVLQTARAHP